MTRQATATIRLSAEVNVYNELDTGLKAALEKFGMTAIGSLTNGIGEGEVNRAIYHEYDMADGATVDLDVYDYGNIDIGNGNGNDALGQALVMDSIVFAGFINSGPGNLTLANGGAGFFVSLLGSCGPGGFLSMHSPGAAGEAISAANALLRTQCSGGNSRISFLILGRKT